MDQTVSFPIFLQYENGIVKSYDSFVDIEKKVEYFLIYEENCEVFDSKGQKLILNVFLNEVKDLYAVK